MDAQIYNLNTALNKKNNNRIQKWAVGLYSTICIHGRTHADKWLEENVPSQLQYQVRVVCETEIIPANLKGDLD